MTACVNKKSKRVAAVVTASLVGALSIGAPAVALAANANIDLQFAAGDEFANGTIGGLKVDGVAVANKDANNVPTVQLAVGGADAEKLPLKVTVSTVTPAGSSKAEAVDGVNYRMRVYKADEKGNPTGASLSGDRILTAGSYVVTVEALSGSNYAGQVYKQALNVKGAAFPTDLVAYENDGDDEDFTFTGSSLTVDHFVGAGDVALTEGVDYTVTFKKDGKDADLKNAGDYTAILTGLGSYSGSSASCKITVKPFTVDSTDVIIAPFTDVAPTTPSRVVDADGTELDPSLIGLTPTDTISDLGLHTFTVSTTDTANVKLASTSLTATGRKVKTIASFKYNNKALEDSYVLNKAAGDRFNLSSITGAYGKNVVSNDKLTFTVTRNGQIDTAGKQHLAEGWSGEYVVTVSCEDTANNEYAGTMTFKVTIYLGAIDADATLYVYDNSSDAANVAITSYAKGYDGTPVTIENFIVAGKDSDGNAVSDGDLIKKLVDSEGNVVSKAVDAGEYKLVVTSKKYLLSGTTELPITIGKVDLTSTQISELVKWNEVAGQEYLPLEYVYNEDEDKFELATYPVNSNELAIANLGLKYDTGNAAASDDADKDYKGLDLLPGNVDIRVEKNDNGTWKQIGMISESGEYRVVATVGEDVASNYVLPEGKDEVVVNFTVATKSYFSDVQPSDWFYSAVNQAKLNGYMNGYGDTSTFGPNDSLTRGQVAVVLFNMSGYTPSKDETDASYNTDKGWNTGFSDVDGKQYYGQAIYWAKKTGVVNGYADGTFRPDQTITREQFAGMLANYAKLVNRDETVGTVDADEALKGFKDASSVSDWAEDAVAWAVSKDVMGNGGSINPAGTLTRAEAAAMSVNYQPHQK